VHFIKPGQRLKIPGRGGTVPTAAGNRGRAETGDQLKVAYTVKPGDTPFGIARNHAMNLEEFLSLNGLAGVTKIFPGQHLWVWPRD
jgi:LysM repeat protein